MVSSWYNEGGYIPPGEDAINNTDKAEEVFSLVSLFDTYLSKFNALDIDEDPEDLFDELEVNSLVVEVIDSEFYDKGRWDTIYRSVYKFPNTFNNPNRFLQVTWAEGSTEYQDSPPNVSACEVWPTSVITYDTINPDSL